MTKPENEKMIKDVLFELLGQLENFEEIEYRFFKAFHLLYEQVTAFKKMSIVSQYQIIHTILLIELGTASRWIREGRILSRPAPSESEVKYSLDYGFKSPDLLKISNRKQLNAHLNDT